MNVLIFDTETNDRAKNFKINAEEDIFNYPYLVQLGAILFSIEKVHDEYQIEDRIIVNDLVYPMRTHDTPNDMPEIEMSEGAEKVHGISKEKLFKEGVDALSILMVFQGLITQADLVIAHNMDFDRNVMVSEFLRHGLSLRMKKGTQRLCTMKTTSNLVKLPHKWKGSKGYKWPSLEELSQHLFNEGVQNAHDAMGDVLATKRCFVELLKRNYYNLD